jgi:hypothetical protein
MVIVCLSGDQWKSWSRIFQKKVCAKSTEDEAFPMLDWEIPDETTYGKVLEIAKSNRPELVQDIEKHKRISDAHQ